MLRQPEVGAERVVTIRALRAHYFGQLSAFFCSPPASLPTDTCGAMGIFNSTYDKPRDLPSVYYGEFFKGLPKMDGKVVAVTGSTTGTGFVCARDCAKLGATVVMLNRESERVDAALKSIREEVPDAKVSAVPCDLTSFASVREAAALPVGVRGGAGRRPRALGAWGWRSMEKSRMACSKSGAGVVPMENGLAPPQKAQFSIGLGGSGLRLPAAVSQGALGPIRPEAFTHRALSDDSATACCVVGRGPTRPRTRPSSRPLHRLRRLRRLLREGRAGVGLPARPSGWAGPQRERGG